MSSEEISNVSKINNKRIIKVQQKYDDYELYMAFDDIFCK